MIRKTAKTANFPPVIEIPVDARVIMKFYKVVGTDDDDGKAVQTKYLNTKVIKVETSLNQQDLYSKSLLMSAIQREAEADPNSLGDEIESESVPDSPVMNDAFVDEPPEWDSDSSAEDDGDSEENSEVEVELAGFNNFNQRRVTRSGRQVAAAKHFMFDD